MGKSSHFIGQPLYGQVIKLLDKSKILQFSADNGSEHEFNCWVHLVVMLYTVIMRHDSLRKTTTSLMAEARKLTHLGVNVRIGRNTLADDVPKQSLRPYTAIYNTTYRQFHQTAETVRHQNE